ncbi:DUF1576 domain-containing protein [Soehngenia longivitae]|uniref:DUF1576 domain-containing protein n=1 Tax=Soehngenia longivitae TaxID=2562294 RepID=A0A4Z0D8Y1_9FIRM|nr:DUF1576 domain-containing protein [Soehngenia longivitae]TFZ41358.1 DUF1576 domain-containing protein [Soehngenia longivitae]
MQTLFYKKNEKHIKYFILFFYCILLFSSAFMFNTPNQIFSGLKTIIEHPDVLIVDYFEVANIGAALLNSSIVMLILLIIVKVQDIDPNGPVISAIFTVTGFSMFGKNIINVLAIILGVFIYSKIKKEKFAKFTVIAFFSTALSPLVTRVGFGSELIFPFNYIFAAVSGLLVGFIMPPLANSFVRFHQGYSLYNVGFTSGIIGMIIASLFRIFDRPLEPIFVVYQGPDSKIKVLIYFISISMIAFKLIITKLDIHRYKNLIKRSGRLVTDFISLDGFDMAIFNMGILGLICLIYIEIIGANLNGPTIAAIFTVMGFGSFGKHPKNVLPVMLGAIIILKITGSDLSDINSILTVFFSTTLAPLTGEFGFFVGLLAGGLHAALVSNLSYLHAGLNLYNNGFSGGFIAAFLVPIITSFREDKFNE